LSVSSALSNEIIQWKSDANIKYFKMDSELDIIQYHHQ